MSRDAERRAKQANDTAVANQKQYGEQSAGIYNKLVPMYTQRATNPEGFSKGDMSTMRTNTMQNTGGSVAGAVEQGNLQSARTGNSGGYATALADAARKGIATNAEMGLKVDSANAALKQEQANSGIAGLQGLETEKLNAAMGSGTQANNAIGTQIEAGKSGWLQNLNATITALSGAATGAANAKKAFG